MICRHKLKSHSDNKEIFNGCPISVNSGEALDVFITYYFILSSFQLYFIEG